MAFTPHPFTLRQLQYVAAVAQELSFRRAAARCHVSQPSLSMQLTQVEEALGVRLFERGRRRVLVTTAGRDFVERAQRLLRDADELVKAARRVADPLSGTISLGVLPTISPYLVPSLTPNLRRAFPRLKVQWTEDTTQALVRKLDDGRLDAAVVALEAELGDVASDVIATDPFVLATRPEHPLAAKESPATSAELRDQEVLLLAEGHCFRDQALELCETARAREGEFRATSLCTLAQMVSSGDGVTLIPSMAVELEATRAGLHVRPLANPSARRTIALVWRKGTPIDELLHAMAQVMREAYPRRGSTRPEPRKPNRNSRSPSVMKARKRAAPGA